MLELKDVSFSVPNDRRSESEIIDHLSFTVSDGEFLVITGPNGSGKSTLAKLIMGIEKPTGGSIFFNGKNITDMPIHERAKIGIGYAFQTPPRFKGMTVRDLLSLAHGDELPEDLCCSFLTSVGLCSRDYLNREVDASLSGGEVKRIEIASLMARRLSLAIFDEPEAGIDLWSFTMLVKSFREMNSDPKKSTIIISHQERIMRLADRLIVLANGQIREEGSFDSVFSQMEKEFSDTCDFRGKRL